MFHLTPLYILDQNSFHATSRKKFGTEHNALKGVFRIFSSRFLRINRYIITAECYWCWNKRVSDLLFASFLRQSIFRTLPLDGFLLNFVFSRKKRMNITVMWFNCWTFHFILLSYLLYLKRVQYSDIGCRSVDFFFIFGQALIFFSISLLKNQGSPCLLRGFLAYMFSGVLIWTQYVKRECEKEDVLRTEISYISQRN